MRSRPVVVAALALAAVAALALAATRGPNDGPALPASSPEVELTVYGAASLKDALETAKAAYESATPGVTLTLSTDSSATLATQIEQGAPVDVFLSADTTNPRKLIEAGLADGDALTFARNELTIIVPTTEPASIRSPADLARAGVTIIAAGDGVPITKYATQLVANLAMEAGYPADFAAAYAANIASREDNVKAIVARIELGEGDAGIVYVTDAGDSTNVGTVDVPDAASVTATYDGIVVRGSRRAAAAKAFLDWFAGSGGQAILGDLGFLPPS